MEQANNPSEHKDNFEQAWDELSEVCDDLPIEEGYGKTMTKILVETQRFLKIQRDSIRGDPNLLPKISNGGKMQFILDRFKKTNLVSHIATKAGVSQEQMFSLMIKVQELFDTIEEGTKPNRAILIMQKMDNLVNQSKKTSEETTVVSRRREGHPAARRSKPADRKSNATAMNVQDEDEDEKWKEEEIEHIIYCHEEGKTSKRGMKSHHEFPPRYPVVVWALRQRDGQIPLKVKKQARVQYKENGKKYGCWSEWEKKDNEFFDSIKSKSSQRPTTPDDSGAAAEPKEKDNEVTEVRKELASLQQVMANMTSAMKKKKKKKKKASQEPVRWENSDSSDSSESSSDDESSESSEDSEDES